MNGRRTKKSISEMNANAKQAKNKNKTKRRNKR